MAVEKILTHFKTQENFEKKLAAGEIDDQILAFINDTQKIWTHGTYFSSLKEVLETLDIKIDINTLLNAEIATSVDYFIGIKDGELKLYKPKDVSYYLECSETADSVVVIDGEEVTIAAGTGVIGICTSIDFPLGTDNLETIYVKGDVDFSLSPQDGYETEENNTLQSLRIIYSDDFERSYDQFCHGFDALKSVKISGSKPTSLDRAFAECLEVTDFDINSINTENVTTMYRLFRHCHALESLDLSSWVTSNVTTMEQTFAYLYALKSLSIKFDTSNVTAMNGMFRDNNVVETLDLSTFDTSKVKEFNAMFRESYALTNLYLGDHWDMGAATTVANMFYDCQSLTNVTGTISNIMLDMDLSYSPLTRESALVFINGLYDYTGSDEHTITFSETTSKLLTYDDIQIAINKNWNVTPVYLEVQEGDITLDDEGNPVTVEVVSNTDWAIEQTNN